MKQQRGGTILGLIIGVVIGLGVALAVAVYVTKVPIPFLNKGQNRTSEQDAAEAKKNKDWDPNAPLYNKVTPKSSATTGKDGKAAGTPVLKSPGRSAASSDPLGDLARAKSAASDPFAYFIQVGAFRASEEAESQRAKLSLTGVEAKVTEYEQSGRQIYRVRVGPYDKKGEAEKVKSQLDTAGYETALVRVQR